MTVVTEIGREFGVFFLVSKITRRQGVDKASGAHQSATEIRKVKLDTLVH